MFGEVKPTSSECQRVEKAKPYAYSLREAYDTMSSMQAPIVIPSRSSALTESDQRVQMRAVSFQAYEAMLVWRGESSVPRMTFLDGVLELMSPSESHEDWKTRLARLFEAWADEVGLDIDGVGSWTLKDRSEKCGAEPDECYVVGGMKPTTVVPDLAIEVAFSRRDTKKLEVYRRLGVREVWFYQESGLSFYVLRKQGYVLSEKSVVFPTFDAALITSFMKTPGSQSQAVAGLRKTMRAKTRKR
jgi:Uma2 family endonuclease